MHSRKNNLASMSFIKHRGPTFIYPEWLVRMEQIRAWNADKTYSCKKAELLLLLLSLRSHLSTCLYMCTCMALCIKHVCPCFHALNVIFLKFCFCMMYFNTLLTMWTQEPLLVERGNRWQTNYVFIDRNFWLMSISVSCSGYGLPPNAKM